MVDHWTLACFFHVGINNDGDMWGATGNCWFLRYSLDISGWYTDVLWDISSNDGSVFWPNVWTAWSLAMDMGQTYQSESPEWIVFLIVSSMFLKVIQQFTTTFLGIFMGFSILFGSSNGGGLSENFSARSSNRCVDHPTQRIGRQARPEWLVINMDNYSLWI